MSGDPTATIRKRALRATVPSPKYFLESPSHAQSTPTKLKRLVSGIEYNRLSSEPAVHRTLRRPRRTSSDSKRKIQISHPHSSFLCKTLIGCLPQISLQRRSHRSVSPGCTNLALPGLTPEPWRVTAVRVRRPAGPRGPRRRGLHSLRSAGSPPSLTRPLPRCVCPDRHRRRAP